jgi:hypothetical protein
MKNHLLVEEKLIKGDNHSFLSLEGDNKVRLRR